MEAMDDHLPPWFRFPEPPRDDEDREDAYCICCDAPTDGSDYCDTCTFGDCPDCV